MATTLQRLNDYQALYNITPTGEPITIADYVLTDYWTPTNAAIYLTAENFYVSNRYLMVISPSSSAPVKISVNATNAILEGDDGQEIIFNAVMRFSVNGVSTKTRMYQDGNVIDGQEKIHNAGIWSAVRSNPMIYSDSISEDSIAEIEISGHNGSVFFMTIPSVYNNLAFINSGAVLSAKINMPDFYWEFDSQATNPSYPFFRFVDICTYPINEASQMFVNWFEYDLAELPYDTGRDEIGTRSALLHPDAFYPEYRDWIAQFVGSSFLKNVYDESDNTTYVSDENEYMRWQARTASYGHNAGSRRAIQQAAQFVLSDSKTVVVTAKFGGDPFVISVKTLVSETPDVAAEGDVSDAVLAAIEPARPVGYQIVHEAVDEIIFTLDDIEQGLLDVGQLG